MARLLISSPPRFLEYIHGITEEWIRSGYHSWISCCITRKFLRIYHSLVWSKFSHYSYDLKQIAKLSFFLFSSLYSIKKTSGVRWRAAQDSYSDYSKRQILIDGADNNAIIRAASSVTNSAFSPGKVRINTVLSGGHKVLYKIHGLSEF